MSVHETGGPQASSVAPGGTPAGSVDAGFWRDRRVLVTGHTGFKGSWLTLWLTSMGAEVTGFSVGVPTDPSLYELGRVGEGIRDIRGDIRDREAIARALDEARPEVVIHMAAQSLVRHSFEHPVETFDVNVMGTVNLLDEIRRGDDVRVIVNVTSDKCYENREWEWGYREDEPMGGHDPYSASKGAAELITAAYRRSFFSGRDDHSARLASVRAGNVIGGGDWAVDRLVADLMRAASSGEVLRVRNPNSIRPWQHVLNPLSGYLLLAQALWDSPDLAGGWNFGPADGDARTVGEIVQRLGASWPGGLRWETDPGPHPHEATYLKLDSSRARARLGWRPTLSLDEALQMIVQWYVGLRAGGPDADMREVTIEQIMAFATTATSTQASP